VEIDIDGPDGPEYDRAYWWGPLEAVAELVKDDPNYADFDVDDFMLMCRYTTGGERVIEYKHIHTRRHLQLSDSGLKAYRYLPPRSLDSDDHGAYRVDGGGLYAALDRLELELAPEMRFGRYRENFEEEPDGDLPLL
jgi:hypothetical protein